MASESNPYFDAHLHHGASGSSTEATSAATLANPATEFPVVTTTPSSPVTEHPSTRTVPPSAARTVLFRPVGDRRQSSIRLRRGSTTGPVRPTLETIPSEAPLGTDAQQPTSDENNDNGNLAVPAVTRQRSNSGSRSLRLAQSLSFNRLPTIRDENQPIDAVDHAAKAPSRPRLGGPTPTRARKGSKAAKQDEYASNIVDFLDVIDPEVATLSSITNVQNSLFVPSLGRFVNRRPTYDLSFIKDIPGAFPEATTDDEKDEEEDEPATRQTTAARSYSITSELTDRHYAVLPSGVSLEGWSQDEVDQMNDHVRHMLHSRRSKLKRSFKAFGQYVRRPLGFAVTLYATLITLFGLAWVLFLIGWIYVGPEKQSYTINVIDNVLVALFAIVGDGLAPFRAVDTYHMIFIVHYHRLTWKLRKKLLMPKLENKNDLPAEPVIENNEDPEAARQVEENRPWHEVSVLTPKQQAKLEHHQAKMTKSHTFYKPHETETHHAFPIGMLIAVILLLDLHSCLQICLGSVTWSIDYRVRSSALTTTILCCSITANTLAGVLITIGDRRTRKKDVIERMFRQELTDYAMRKVQKERRAQEERDAALRKDMNHAGKFDTSAHFPRVSMDIDTEKDEMRRIEHGDASKRNDRPEDKKPDGHQDGTKVDKHEIETAVPGSFPSPTAV